MVRFIAWALRSLGKDTMRAYMFAINVLFWSCNQAQAVSSQSRQGCTLASSSSSPPSSSSSSSSPSSPSSSSSSPDTGSKLLKSFLLKTFLPIFRQHCKAVCVQGFIPLQPNIPTKMAHSFLPNSNYHIFSPRKLLHLHRNENLPPQRPNLNIHHLLWPHLDSPPPRSINLHLSISTPMAHAPTSIIYLLKTLLDGEYSLKVSSWTCMVQSAPFLFQLVDPTTLPSFKLRWKPLHSCSYILHSLHTLFST